MDYEQILKGLCSLAGPSGFEQEVAQEASRLLRPWLDQVSIDPMGNVLGVKRCGKEGAYTVLLDAHLDEIGFLVTGYQDGFLQFTTLGGVDPRMLPDAGLKLLTQPPLSGVVTCMPPHLQKKEERKGAIPLDALYLDVGLPPQRVKEDIPIGTPAVYDGCCSALGQKLLCGKALDDRAGFGVLVDVAQRLSSLTLDVDVYYLGSVQEETHSTGAMTAVYGLDPDCCIAVDVTHGDCPQVSQEKTFALGKGPAIGVGPNCTHWITQRMKRRARELDIPVQLEVMAGSSGTNGWPMQISREGIATGVLSIPLRFMHTPVEVVHQEDLCHTAQLLTGFLQGLGEEMEKF